MNSPELLLLVENCPKGAETLVTRCLHSLTDKGAWVPPSIFPILPFQWVELLCPQVTIPVGFSRPWASL